MVSWYRFSGANLVFLLFVMLLVGVVPDVGAQGSMPGFYFDAINARPESGSSQTRVDFYTRIPYASLRFINSGSAFVARYEVSAAIFGVDSKNRKKNLVLSRNWDQTASAPSFSVTQSPQLIDRMTQSVELAPGRYLVEVKIRDKTSGESASQSRALFVRDLNKPAALSDLILLDGYNTQNNTITPSVVNRVTTDTKSLRLFYEVYSRTAQRVRMVNEVIRVPKGNGVTGLMSIFGMGRNNVELEDIAYSKVEATPVRAGRNQVVVEIPIGDVKAGDYLLRVRMEDENGHVLDVTDKAIAAEWNGLDDHIKDLNQAIAQLGYIAKGKDLQAIRSARSDAERMARFKQFWAKRDPTPGTERNERMEEYYYRINYANRQFGGLTDGWKTDRGHVAIIYGEPDFVERHSSNAEAKPYEVWYYYKIGRQFIFVDKSGLGDFHLREPIWDERSQIR